MMRKNLVPKNHCLALIESRWKEEYVTPSGFRLYRETLQHERRYDNTETCGIVVAMFDGLTNNQYTRCADPSKDLSRAKQMEDIMMPYSALEGTFAGLRVGDKIHFSYEMSSDKRNEEGDKSENLSMPLTSYPQFAINPDDTKGEIVKVMADHIICIERDGQLIAVGGKALIDPIEEEELELKANGIYIPDDFRKQKALNSGRLVSSSVPMKGLWGLEPEPGDIVFYNRAIAEWVEINGKRYEWAYTTEVDAYAKAGRRQEVVSDGGAKGTPLKVFS